MTKNPKPPKFGTLVRDSVYADGKGGTLTYTQYHSEFIKRKRNPNPANLPDITDEQWREWKGREPSQKDKK